MASCNSCTRCGEVKTLYNCPGCQKSFCFTDLGNHREELERQFHDIEDQRNYFREVVTEQKKNPNKHLLIEQINKWEYESIEKIKNTAEEQRTAIRTSVIQLIDQIEMKLERFTDELKQIQKKNDFNEIILNNLRKKLQDLEIELNKSENVSVRCEDLYLSLAQQVRIKIKKPFLEQTNIPNIPSTMRWKQNAITVAGGNGNGNGLNQIKCPWSMCIDDEGSLYVAEEGNDRIVKWKVGATAGQVVAGGNNRGNRDDQLNIPLCFAMDKKNHALVIADTGNRRVVRWTLGESVRNGETIISDIGLTGIFLDNNGDLYVCDNKKCEVRRWKVGDKEGKLVAGGNGKGNHLNQLYMPQFIFVDEEESVYISNFGNDRVVKWTTGAKEGIIVAGGQGQGNKLAQLSNPYGLVVDKSGNVYVADRGNNRIMRWLKNAREGTVIVGGNDEGSRANQFNGCINLAFDDCNNLYVADYNNHRIQKFEIDSFS